MAAESNNKLIAAGETLSRSLSLSRAEISHFARLSGDLNPLHHDPLEAERAGFGDVIASGQHTAAMLIGLVASHCSRCDDGVQREVLCLNMNFAFKRPVLAGEMLTLEWRVSTALWHTRLGGQLAQIDGGAVVAGAGTVVVARGTILVKELK